MKGVKKMADSNGRNESREVRLIAVSSNLMAVTVLEPSREGGRRGEVRLMHLVDEIVPLREIHRFEREGGVVDMESEVASAVKACGLEVADEGSRWVPVAGPVELQSVPKRTEALAAAAICAALGARTVDCDPRAIGRAAYDAAARRMESGAAVAPDVPRDVVLRADLSNRVKGELDRGEWVKIEGMPIYALKGGLTGYTPVIVRDFDEEAGESFWTSSVARALDGDVSVSLLSSDLRRGLSKHRFPDSESAKRDATVRTVASVVATAMPPEPPLHHDVAATDGPYLDFGMLELPGGGFLDMTATLADIAGEGPSRPAYLISDSGSILPMKPELVLLSVDGSSLEAYYTAPDGAFCSASISEGSVQDVMIADTAERSYSEALEGIAEGSAVRVAHMSEMASGELRAYRRMSPYQGSPTAQEMETPARTPSDTLEILIPQGKVIAVEREADDHGFPSIELWLSQDDGRSFGRIASTSAVADGIGMSVWDGADPRPFDIPIDFQSPLIRRPSVDIDGTSMKGDLEAAPSGTDLRLASTEGADIPCAASRKEGDELGFVEPIDQPVEEDRRKRGFRR